MPRVGPSSVVLWVVAATDVGLAVLAAVDGKSGRAAVFAGLAAGLAAVNNVARAWQARHEPPTLGDTQEWPVRGRG